MRLAPLLAALVACGQPPTAPEGNSALPNLARSATAPVKRVSGGGKLDVSAFGLPAETYAFSASVDGDGTVKGEMQIRFSDPATDLHAEVTCLSVAGNSAWIGGIVMQTHDPLLVPVGTEFWLRLQDNGQGGNDPPDRMSFVRLGLPASFCNLQRPVTLPFAWLHGNIQIR